MAISAIKSNNRKIFFCKKIYHDIVVQVPNFHLFAKSSSFFCAHFLHFYEILFLWTPIHFHLFIPILFLTWCHIAALFTVPSAANAISSATATAAAVAAAVKAVRTPVLVPPGPLILIPHGKIPRSSSSYSSASACHFIASSVISFSTVIFASQFFFSSLAKNAKLYYFDITVHYFPCMFIALRVFFSLSY